MVGRADDYSLTDQPPTTFQVYPDGMAACEAKWNNVYADGYKFAERAPAALACSYTFQSYRTVGDEQVTLPFSQLRGPTWLKVNAAVNVCDSGPGCTGQHIESIEGLVRVEGDMAEAPSPTCKVAEQSGPNGSIIRFSGSDANSSKLDSVVKWAFLPADFAVSGTTVTATRPGKVTAVYGLTNWYGPSSATCSATVGGDPVATRVSAPAVKQVYGDTARLRVTVSPDATGTVSAKVGRKKVNGNVTAGKATVVLPATALKPGKHSITLAYQGDPGTFKPSSGKVTVTVLKASPTIKVSGPKTVQRGKVAKFKATVTAAGVRPTGKVRFKVAGTSWIGKLKKNGQATVKVRISKSAKPGKSKVVATYRGDAYVVALKAAPKRITVKGR
jgi:hypothetical protein